MKNHTLLFFFFSCTVLVSSCKDEKIPQPASPTEIQIAASELESGLSQNEAVRTFYEERNYAPVWNDRKLRNSVHEALKKADEQGLFYIDYHGKKIDSLLEKEDNLTPLEPAQLEIFLTDAFLNYAHDLFYGKLDPKKMYAIWDVDRKEIDLSKILDEAVKNNAIESSLADLQPQNEIYEHLKNSLQEYKEKIENGTKGTNIEEGEAIEPNKKDPRIPSIAKRLKELDFLSDGYEPQGQVYDKKLQRAVEKFQDETKLITDTVLGNSTIQQLNLGPRQRYDQILANLERWRWYPRDLGEHYFLINIAEYELTVAKNGETVKKYNVIAGEKTNQTPIFSDSIQYIVINPQWHIPTSIAVNEIIPSAARNSNYLSSRNIFVTDSKGERIDPSSINWSSGAAKNYRFTQGSGASNSLGRVKIIYPNDYAIYLHDTPAKSIFDQNLRAESHGCVRVENALNLAAYVLADQKNWDLDKINEVVKTGATQRVEVTQPINIHHFYWTAANENGKAILINDIYNLDQGVYEALKK